MMETGLRGKRILVTGASGGIGSVCVREYLAEGADVVAHYHRNREGVEALGDVQVVQADLTAESEVDRLFEEAGTLDACAAVAGVWPRPDEPVWELSLARWEETLRLNLTATFLTARGFLRSVERTGHGSLVLVASTAGVFGEAGHADYSAAKAAIAYGLTLSLKNEVVRIAPLARVNCVCPGWTKTPMAREEIDDPEIVDGVTRTMALRKVATPEDVARQIVVLTSDELSGHVTGQVVVVAGGMEGRTIH